ncbi:tripartite tricarboxylate transporter substrate-binding protein [Variovorax sp. SRS16]|uniref:tripartite tricarboxylate transporter substrate-binding protein n=1 Tax=Variovorax sp. SRS16 TaxID=282217 RepID=UPI001E353ABE|nr:tripartite tricarboxylate transporter substrate-binding protein [Variovorax sp. SRS16]
MRHRTFTAFRSFGIVCMLAAALASPGPAEAAANMPVKLVVGFPPGGALDILARAIADQMRIASGEPVLVENRPGASTRIAIEAVKRASPDGRTILLASSAPFVIFPMTYRHLNYDVDRDFIPVAQLVDVPTVVSTAADQPYKTLPEYVAWVRSHPGQGSFGMTSLGGALHFSVLGMSRAIGVPLVAVPYKGGAPLATDIIGGQIPIGTDALASQLELHRAGKLRILGVSGLRRNRWLPEVPTLKESGIDAFDHANASYGAYVPAGTPREVVERLEHLLIAAVGNPQVQAQLARIGLEPVGLPGAELASSIRAERVFWRPIVESSGFKSDD